MNPARFCRVLMVLVLLFLSACASGSPSQGALTGGAAQSPQRTLVGISRGQPPTLAMRSLTPFAGSVGVERPAFNAGLDLTDERGRPQPYLIEALPLLGTESWQVAPGGTMRTTYQLRANLTWHDGTSFSAEDFVFAWRLYATPDFGQSQTAPIRQIQEVTASDARTLVIDWRQTYAAADALGLDLPPLPRHVLEEPFRTLDREAFAAHPYWTTDYVGLGAFRLTRWEHGAFLEGAAFAGHALGVPRIPSIRIMFISDASTALANLLAGEAQFIGDFILTPTDGDNLERMWADSKVGTVLWSPTTLRHTWVQLRPDVADPQALLDVRVRRALAYAMDAETAVWDQHYGKALRSSTLTSPLAEEYPEVAAATTRFDYDPARAGQLLEEAGFVKGADGFLLDREGKRLAIDYRTFFGARGEQENAVFVDGLRRVGLDARQRPYTEAEARDGQILSTFPALSFRGTGARAAMQMHISQQISRPETRWQGTNYAAWASPEYDRLFEAYTTALDKREIVRLTAQMEKMLTDDVPSIVHYFIPGVVAHLSILQGPTVVQVPTGAAGWTQVYRWEWRS